MALNFIDGFDHYRTIADFISGRWTYGDLVTSVPFVNGRFAGRSANQAEGSTYGSWNPTHLKMTINSNLSTIIVGIANWASSSGLVLINFIDGTTYQCYVIIDTTSGVVSAYRGSPGGSNTLLLSSTSGQYVPNTWQFIEVKAVIASGTSGSITVRIGEVTVLNVTGVNTQNTGNAYANSLYLETANCTTCLWDDFYVLDSTSGPGANPMNNFLGDKRVISLYPDSNSSTQWTPTANATFTNSYPLNSTTNISDSVLYISQGSDSTMSVRAPCNCSVLSSTLYWSGAYSGYRATMFLYSDDGTTSGLPLSLLATSNEVINIASGANTFNFASPPSMVKGTLYHFGFIINTNYSYMQTISSGVGAGNNFLMKSSTYPTAPANVVVANFTATMSGGDFPFSYTRTSTNFANVNEIVMDGNSSYNAANTVGFKDLFTVSPQLPAAVQVLAIQLTGAYAKDDANSRSIAQVISSGGNESVSANHSLSASYTYVNDIYVQDPNGNVSWTANATNNMLIGYKVTV